MKVENNNKEYTKVTFRVPSERYAEYKKIMIDNRTTPTADLNRHILDVLKNPEKSKK